MKEKFEYITKFIEDKNLTIAQQEVLRGFKEYIKEKKPHLTRYYLRDLFYQAKEFAILIRKPFEEANSNDFEKFYQHCIGDKGISQITIEGYHSRLKALYEFIFFRKREFDKFSEVEKTIKHIFKKRLIETRRKLNESDIDKEEKFKTIKRYLNEGIKRKKFGNYKFVGYEQVKLSEDQRNTLKQYYKRLRSGTFCKIGIHGLSANFRTLFQFGEFIKKPFEEVIEEDFVNYFFKLEEENKSVATINSYKHILKAFYTHHLDKEKLVERIKPVRKEIRKKDDEMLSPSEIRGMIEKCTHPRDKALIMITYDGAMRQGEVLGIQLKHIVSDEHGYKITLTGKTGTRSIRVIDAVPYLKDWLNYHPFKEDSNSFLFINLKTYGRRLKENGIAQVIKKSAEVAGLTKRVYPHLLRHSKLNQLAKEGFNERDLRIFAGWSSDSKMPDTYLHYGEDHVDRKMLEKRGIFKDENKQKIEDERKKLEPKNCPRCEKVQPADAMYCNCGMVLDQKEAVNLEVLREKANNFTNKLMQEPMENTDLSKGLMEALFQKMLMDEDKVKEFKKMLTN
ncbi:tyrosine-type recombinase/integrase [Candidatus Woesearchaeota archaeon]|jgi:integrase|nr:tyrosine-type recombinase/integrase [Candidatus Woesearchaeota archaeon]